MVRRAVLPARSFGSSFPAGSNAAGSTHSRSRNQKSGEKISWKDSVKHCISDRRSKVACGIFFAVIVVIGGGVVGILFGFGVVSISSPPSQEESPASPAQPFELSFYAIDGGYDGSIFIASGTPHACGQNVEGGIGSLGVGSAATTVTTPTGLVGVSSAVRVARGDGHSCVVLSDGSIQCVGRNSAGQSGQSASAVVTTPAAVSGVQGAIDVVTGRSFSCALLHPSRTVSCWGDNSAAQLGSTSPSHSSTPATVQGLANVSQIACGADHCCAVTAAGSLCCWGGNQLFQADPASSATVRASPVCLQGLPASAKKVAVGSYTTCALLSNGIVKCFGANSESQALVSGGGTVSGGAFGSTPSSLSLVDVSGKRDTFVALSSDGKAYAWGEGDFGQLGTVGGPDSSVPLHVATAYTFKVVKAMKAGVIGITSDESCVCWGANIHGEVCLDPASTGVSMAQPVVWQGTKPSLITVDGERFQGVEGLS